MSQELKILVTSKAQEHGIDPDLLNALVLTESKYNPWAVRFEPDYRWLYDVPGTAKLVGTDVLTMKTMQQTSYGLGQVMSAVAYEYGFKGWAPMLCDPVINLNYVCMHLNKQIKRHSLKDFSDIYACYNAGSIQKKNGMYSNQKNVTRFEINLVRIRTSKASGH